MAVASRALHGVAVCVIPSPYNDDRPFVLRRKPLAFISATLLAIKALAGLTLLLAPTPAELSTITANRIVQFTNAERTAAGLPELTINSALSAAAKDKGNNMLEQDYFAHISPTGVTPWFWINKYNYDYLVAGENLAIDFTEAEDVVAAWMASPSHKANIVHSEYTETGVAVVTGEFQGGTSTIVVHMFGKPSGAVAASSSTPTPSPTPASTQEATTSPSPSPTPTPTPTPVPTIAPSPNPSLPSPRIAVNKSTPFQTNVFVQVSGTAGSTVHILVNGEVVTSALLENETQSIGVPIHTFSDGELLLQAYATPADASLTTSSDLSSAITITKDTSGPDVSLEELVFVVNPAVDLAEAATTVPQSESEATTLISAASPQSIEATDELGNVTTLELVSLTPIFDETATDQDLSAPRRMVRLSRQIAGTVLLILLGLLSIAIIVRIRVQHPTLIAHGTLAILLAATLFFL